MFKTKVSECAPITFLSPTGIRGDLGDSTVNYYTDVAKNDSSFPYFITIYRELRICDLER